MLFSPSVLTAEVKPSKSEFPDKDEVLKDYELIVSSMDKSLSLLQLYINRKKNQILAALPKKFESKKFYIATTKASGEELAGLQAGEKYVYFKRIGKRIMIMEPNLILLHSNRYQNLH